MNKHIDSGVWEHSRPYIYRDYVIFCVGNNIRKASAFRYWATSEGIGFKSLKGCYKGQTEDSFIIAADNLERVRPWIKDQESILWLYPMVSAGRVPASLIYQDGKEVKLGDLVVVGYKEALKAASWTYDPSTNTYYICK